MDGRFRPQTSTHRAIDQEHGVPELSLPHEATACPST